MGEASKNRFASRFRGFSLSELVLCIGILSGVILLVMGTFVFLFRASQKSVDLTAGIEVADTMLNREIQLVMQTPSSIQTFFGSPPVNPIMGPSTYNLNQTAFTYQITATDLVGLMPAGTAELGMPKEFSCTVNWWGKSTNIGLNSRDGYGNLSVTLVRIVSAGGY